MERNVREEQEGAPWDRLKPRTRAGIRPEPEEKVAVDAEVEESATRRVRESVDRPVREPIVKRIAEPSSRHAVREPLERPSSIERSSRIARPVERPTDDAIDYEDADETIDTPVAKRQAKTASSFLPANSHSTAMWVALWIGLAVVGLFVLTIGGTLLFDLRWGGMVEVTLALAIGFGVVLALAGMFVSSVYSTMALRRFVQVGSFGGPASSAETLRPILVLPPPTIAEDRRATHHEGELEAGPRLPGGQKWNARLYNIGAGPALNGEARLYRRAHPENAIILTVEPIGAGQFVDLAAAELPREKANDLELMVSYQDLTGRRFVTNYRFYARGEREAMYWIGPADIEPDDSGE